MNSISSLQQFVGKVCTITTVQINFRFKEEHMMDYFMGQVESIDSDGITIVHPATKCRTYVFLPYVVAIAEEQVLYENVPEHAKIIEQYRKEKPEVAARTAIKDEKPEPPKPVAPTFLNPKALAEMAKKAKASFQQKEQK